MAYSGTNMEFEIVESKKIPHGYIILATLPFNRITPWATWWTKEVDGINTDRHSGHYYRCESDARVGFSNREF
jgi:hypothetical protein